MTDVLPGPAAKEIRELLERYVGLQPHEADNLSVLLYDADAAALPLAAIRELESIQKQMVTFSVMWLFVIVNRKSFAVSTRS